MYKSGFVTVIGRPNVGKSTLLNTILGEKVSIISDKPQTTRNKIQCVYTEENLQIVFLDTPGIHNPKNKLGEYMVKMSRSTLEEVDIITFMVDDSKYIGSLDDKIIKDIKDISTPKILLINKIDKINKEELGDIINTYDKMGLFQEIIPISASENLNVSSYLDAVKKYLKEGPQYFPEDMITDQPERLIISELIREKVLYYLDEEVPHGIFVAVDMINERKEKNLIDVYATIYCEKESHKGIVIGKNGRKLKGIGKSAREDIEKLLGSQINLQLWVKVEKNWRDKENKIKYFGYQ
ncbi:MULTISPECIES: GTPase Era [Tissierellales]|uniref:GTPase Era n=1 Tax=Acidilutibacter cellobiosedens TaxID=2507161 RepID=A0A410QDS1_9FIRM|nr:MULTISPECIES: GTPase Era [Tissierellales]QAT62141.1 GTPase Era [Acidilutibacter cellobiosedens]SCL84509.1 GTPase Era [Sporanaerobacter sp. PP17-6a]